MQVSTYLNPTSRNPTYSTDWREDRAYLAPLPKVGGQKRAVDPNDVFLHDIYDDIRNPPYRSYGDSARFQPRRNGIYVHWSLPQLYRKAIAASATGTDVKSQKAAAGVPISGAAATADQASDLTATQPTFRPVPDRYIISRTVTAGAGTGKIMIRTKDDTMLSGYKQQVWTAPSSGASINQSFVVSSVSLTVLYRDVDSIGSCDPRLQELVVAGWRPRKQRRWRSQVHLRFGL